MPHTRSSFSQCASRVLGATIRARTGTGAAAAAAGAPAAFGCELGRLLLLLMPLLAARAPAKNALHCMVLPRPMSSARMPPLPILWGDQQHTQRDTQECQ
jgi:hypothetical protein